MLLLARSAAITKKPYRSNKNNVSLQLKARVNANMRLVLNTSLVAAFNAKGYANFSMVELDRSIKKTTNRNERKCWHVFGYSCFVINAAQLFCINNRIWHPINSLERQSVILELTASAAFAKQNPKQNILLPNSTFYILSFDI